MIVFAGIPSIYYGRLTDLARTRLKSEEFTGLGLKPFGGRYEIDDFYCEELLETIARYIEGRPESVMQGLAIIIVRRTGQKPEETVRLEKAIWPFALYKTICVDYPIRDRGEGLRQAANAYSEVAISEGQKLASLLRYVNNIYITQLKRTPLLLPLCRFDSKHLVNMIGEILALLPTGTEPANIIEQACRRFLAQHPRRREGQGVIFENNSGTEFKTPPRSDFHGTRSKVVGELGHNAKCFLTARLRIGGYYSDGFHYDCRRGSIYSGYFENCHHAMAYYKGNPQLNIFPNDYIR
jgi:hypothetical protein